MSHAPMAVPMSARAVTTTDLLKTIALVFVAVDHVGYYFVANPEWWRVLGRIAAPIFFFLIGFARSRSVPWTWLALGGLITVLDVAGSGDPLAARFNILLNFALIRWALPLLERRILASRAGAIGFIAICALLSPVAGLVLEYGSEGWLWALTGLLSRRFGDGSRERDAGIPGLLITTALFAGLVYFIVEAGAHQIDGAALVVMGGLVVALVAVLLSFRRQDLPRPPPAPLAAILRFGGRWSLELYAAHLILLEVWTLVD